MPWQKYSPRPGKYGPIYQISKGITVRRDSRGKWTIFIEKGGVRKNKTIGSGKENRSKAIMAAEAIVKQLDSLEPNKPSEQRIPKTPLFQKYSEEWLEGNAGRWDYQTYQRYEGLLRLHIWPHKSFKGKTLCEISKKDIKVFLGNLLKIRSSATVELAHVVIYGVYDEATEDEDIVEITENPASKLLSKVLPPKAKRNKSEPDPFDTDERARFLCHAEDICTWTENIMLKVMFFMGFRLGETLAMRLRHLDLMKQLYHVSQSFRQYNWGLPKKGKKRFVDIPEFLAKELRQYLAHMKKESLKEGKGGEIDLLFPDPQESNYNPFSQRKLQRLVERICKGAKLRVRHPPHDLRHTYATVLLMAHQSPYYVMKQMGHSSISITVDIYGHWIPGEGREGLEEALLGSGQEQQKETVPNIV